MYKGGLLAPKSEVRLGVQKVPELSPKRGVTVLEGAGF